MERGDQFVKGGPLIDVILPPFGGVSGAWFSLGQEKRTMFSERSGGSDMNVEGWVGKDVYHSTQFVPPRQGPKPERVGWRSSWERRSHYCLLPLFTYSSPLHNPLGASRKPPLQLLEQVVKFVKEDMGKET